MQDIIKITLTDDQRCTLAPALDAYRQANDYEGVFCTLSRAYCTRGGTVLELQVVRVSRAKARKVLQLLTST